MSDVKQVAFSIQGEPTIKVETAYVWMETPELVAIGIQTDQRVMVDATGGGDVDGPGVMVSLTTDPDSVAYIELPGYQGWEVWSADASKHTVHLCIYKPRTT